MKEDFYETLGVARGAGKDEIKSAYRRLAMKHHPDRNPGDAAAESKFKKVQEAYDTLSDSEKRAAYDRFGHAAFEHARSPGGGAHDFSGVFDDLFGHFFGAAGAQPREERERPRVFDMQITFEEAALGCQKTLNVVLPARCEKCVGTGAKAGTKPVQCRACAGAGQIRVSRGMFTLQQTCPECRGAGQTIKTPCPECAGKGKTQTRQKISAAVPAGVNDGEMIRLAIEGSGEMFLRMSVAAHPIFRRDGENLHITIPVSVATASLGGEVRAPALGGGAINVTVPPETQSGKILRLRGRGVGNPRSRSGERGDMLCKIIVETPVNLDAAQKKLLRQFDASLKTAHSPQKESWLKKAKNIFTE